MELHKITGDLSVAGQLEAAELPLVAGKGFRSIICNRPDGEAPGQPAFGPIEEAAAALGIKTAYQPVSPNSVSDADGAAFGKLLEELPKPILAYCRSGTRCTVLWALSEAPRRPHKDIVLQAMRAGYDLTGLIPRLLELHRP
jgi:sulfide:quinone oxidoreductase